MLRPLLGRELRKDGQKRGVVDEHGVGVTCAQVDGSFKTAHDQIKHLLADEARAAGVAVEVEVFGAFTRALREADVRKVDDYLRTRPGEKQGIIPDLLFDLVDYMELKGIRSDGCHRNYNGAAVTGVEKRAAKWLVELQNKAVRLDREVFGVQQPALGGRSSERLQEIAAPSADTLVMVVYLLPGGTQVCPSGRSQPPDSGSSPGGNRPLRLRHHHN